MHSGNKWRSAVWLNAMHCGKKWSIRVFVNPVYVAARSLRSLRSNYIFLLNLVYVAARSLRSNYFLRVDFAFIFRWLQ